MMGSEPFATNQPSPLPAFSPQLHRQLHHPHLLPGQLHHNLDCGAQDTWWGWSIGWEGRGASKEEAVGVCVLRLVSPLRCCWVVWL
jgi:hypothetical protein